MNEKIYVCECGKEFDNSQRFNGHKGQCKTHLILVGKYENRMAGNRKMHEGSRLRAQERRAEKEQLEIEKLQQWISEQHRCKKCNQVMTKYWGTGTYCSASCAHGHPKSQESRDKTRETIIKEQLPRRKVDQEKQYKLKLEQYLQSPNKCCICGKEFSYEQRNRQACDDCVNILISIKRKKYIEEHGYNLNTTVKSRYKYGTYKDISCDSSWELAFVMYHLDHQIPFIRNKSKYFEYEFNGNTHRFYPDFIVDDTYIEIKSRYSDETDAKVASMPASVNFQILYEQDLQMYFDYVKDTYGEDYYKLYDRNYPSWMDKDS